MEPLRREESVRRLVAVFPSGDAARAAANDVRQAGVADSDVEVDAGGDEVAALRGEMSQEMRDTIVGPGNVGPFTKEMTKGFVPATALATLIGAVVAAPLGLVEFGGLDLWARLLIAAAVGAFGGATWGFVSGGAGRWEMAVADKQLATERGVTVGVWTDATAIDRVSAVLEGHRPIRIDQVTPEGHPLRTVANEEDDPA